MPIQVLADSNFLLIPFQFNVDIFEGLEEVFDCKVELLVLPQVLSEVRRIACGRGEDARRAKLALNLILPRCRLLELDDVKDLPADEALFRAALKLRIPVATNDRRLRRRLRVHGIPTVFLRQYSRLEVDGYVP